MRDNYKILELSKEDIANLDLQLLNKKYKKVAFKYHPDRPNGDEVRFKEIANAYNDLKKIISNQDKYDKGKEDEFKNYTEKIINNGEYFKGLFSKIKNLDVDDMLSKFMKYTNEIKNIYDDRNCIDKTDDIIVNITVSLEDLYNDEDKIITLNRTRRCMDCYDNELRFCVKCNNTNYTSKDKSYIFCCSDSIIIFANESNEERNKKPGDIIIKITPKKNNTYTIINNYDILYTINSNKLEDIKHSFKYLDGKTYNLNAIYPWRSEYILKNKGLSIPYSEKRGKLIIKINYIPNNLIYNDDNEFTLNF